MASLLKIIGVPVLLAAGAVSSPSLFPTVPPKKPHHVGLGAVKQVPYSKAGDPAGAAPDETMLKLRPLLVDDRLSEWTTGEAHDITDRSFTVRRALRVNDSLPPPPADSKVAGPDAARSDPARAPTVGHWVWQRGPWLLVDRATGHVTPLKLPDYDSMVSQVAWFRDYGAYCGVTATGKSLYAVVAQVSVRKPVLAKKLAAYEAGNHPWPVCAAPEWQRDPLQVTFHPSGANPASFDLAGGSTALVEGDDPESASEKPAATP